MDGIRELEKTRESRKRVMANRLLNLLRPGTKGKLIENPKPYNSNLNWSKITEDVQKRCNLPGVQSSDIVVCLKDGQYVCTDAGDILANPSNYDEELVERVRRSRG